jgi:hypothetical protein
LQEISLTRPLSNQRVHAILLDTVSTFYGVRINSLPNLLNALIGPFVEYIPTYDAMVARWLDDAGDSNTSIILMGHSPVEKSPISSKIKRWMTHPSSVLYISSRDEGEGEYRWNGKGSSNWLEIVAGAIGTWPHAVLSFSIGSDKDNAVLLRTSYSALGEDWEKFGIPKCMEALDDDYEEGHAQSYPSFSQLSGTLDKLLGHKLTGDEYLGRVQRVQLSILRRLIKNNPTTSAATDPPTELNDKSAIARIDRLLKQMDWSPKTAALEIRKLESFESVRKKESPEAYAAYRTCQALWASKAEYHRNRVPSIKDPYVLLRWPDSGHK